MITELPKLEDSDEHQKSFEQQPIITKELELLNEQVEKTIGKETSLLHETIREISNELPETEG
jgi:hypothetical protein